MHWRLLQQITELEPGQRAAATARTDFPPKLFADHFPGFAITPGVLLIEMGAQLAGRLVEITASQRRGLLLLPFLTMVLDSKLRRFVPPHTDLRVEATLEELRGESAICSATVFEGSDRAATMRLMFAFEPDGKAAAHNLDAVIAFERSELHRLGLHGFPPGPVTVAPRQA